MLCKSEGPIPATIAVIGEAPGRDEERLGRPFIGASGSLLTNLLLQLGWSRSNIFITNVCQHRPPENDINEWLSPNKRAPDPTWEQVNGLWCHPNVIEGRDLLLQQLSEVKPQLVITLGNTPLWALTNYRGVLKWRGSRLSWNGAHLVPTIHPAAVLRQREMLPILRMDFNRAKNILEGTQTPREYQFLVQPTFEQALACFTYLLGLPESAPLSVDIETRSGRIACLGVAWSATEAACFPILQASSSNPFYWTVEQEAAIRVQFSALLKRHPIIGQNFLYDSQYFHREAMGYPSRVFDTMIGHHSIYAPLRKGLDFLSSMYAHDHVYWKDESKNWDPELGETQLWTYNCKDACITYEVAEAIHNELQVRK